MVASLSSRAGEVQADVAGGHVIYSTLATSLARRTFRARAIRSSESTEMVFLPHSTSLMKTVDRFASSASFSWVNPARPR